MPQATIFKSAGTCTDTSLPILYRDPAASSSTLFCYDVLDTYSWPSQAAPVGASSLVDLSAVGANASIGATALGWDDGFVFNGDADLITLPASSKLASDVAGFAISIWIKNTTAAGSGKGIAGIGEGFTYAATQWGLHRDAGNMQYAVDGDVRGGTAITVGAVTNWVITMELSGSTYTHRLWKNGSVILTNTSTAPMVVPTRVAANIGAQPGVFDAGGDDFVFYRCHADSLASRTAAQFVAAEYAVGVGRFS